MIKKEFSSEILNNPSKFLGEAKKAVQEEVLQEVAGAIQSDDVAVTVMPEYLQITERRLNSMGVIDLKPSFARSSKKKYAKDGHWYMFIPIQLKVRNMPRKSYDELRSMPMRGNRDTVTLSDIIDSRRGKSSLDNWNVKAKGKKVNRTKTGKGRTSYNIFRTVNQYSPPNSWIIGRDKISEDNLSKTAYENARRLMDWKIKNI